MNNKKIIRTTSIISLLFSFSLISLAFAKQTEAQQNEKPIETQNQRQLLIETRQQNENASGSNVNVNINRENVKKYIPNTDQEISRNTESLQNILNRIEDSKAIPQTQKNIISEKIQSQINNLENIKNQLGNNNSSSSIRDQRKIIQETVQNMRLIIPQANISVAANRILSVASMTTEISGKLQIRITEMQNSGQNISSSSALLTDISTQVSNAQKLVQIALSNSQNIATSTLVNTTSTIIRTYTIALQTARDNIVSAQKDLQIARKDIGQIIKLIMPNKERAQNNTSSTTH